MEVTLIKNLAVVSADEALPTWLLCVGRLAGRAKYGVGGVACASAADR